MTSRLFLIRLPLLLITVLVLQHSGIGDISIQSVRPDFMLALVCASGVVGGREKGALIGFLAGILTDSFLVTPFGFTALVYTIVGYLAGEMERLDQEQNRILDYLVVGAASALGVSLESGLGFLLGVHDPLRRIFVTELAVVSLINLAISPLFVFGARFSLVPQGSERRISSRR